MIHNKAPYEIKVNKIPVQLGQPALLVYSLEINYFISPIRIQKAQKLQITEWLWDLVQKCKSDYITFQGVLIPKEDVRKYGSK